MITATSVRPSEDPPTDGNQGAILERGWLIGQVWFLRRRAQQGDRTITTLDPD